MLEMSRTQIDLTKITIEYVGQVGVDGVVPKTEYNQFLVCSEEWT